MTFVSQNNKNYQSLDEYNLRFSNFKANQAKIDELNSNPDDTAKYGLNALSDLSDTEFKAMLGVKLNDQLVSNKSKGLEIKGMLGAVGATSFDWRNTAGKVSAVKNQGACGSCWAFSAAEAIESIWAIKKNTLYSLSPQHLLDCAYSSGCNGGHPANAFYYAAINKGLNNDTAYPYKAVKGTCSNKGALLAPITNYGLNNAQVSDATMMYYVN